VSESESSSSFWYRLYDADRASSSMSSSPFNFRLCCRYVILICLHQWQCWQCWISLDLATFFWIWQFSLDLAIFSKSNFLWIWQFFLDYPWIFSGFGNFLWVRMRFSLNQPYSNTCTEVIINLYDFQHLMGKRKTRISYIRKKKKNSEITH